MTTVMQGRDRLIPREPKTRARMSNGVAMLSTNVDGRSVWARRLRDLISMQYSDLGGEDNVTESEKAIIRRAVVLMIELERLEEVFATAGEAQPDQLELYARTS